MPLLLAIALALPGAAAAAPGDLDPAFDGDGRFTLGLPGHENVTATGIEPGPDGETLLSGVATAGSDDAIVLVRLADDGSVIRSSSTPVVDETPVGAVRHGDGLVVGTRTPTGLRGRRFGSGEALDPAFGEEGVATPAGETVQSIAVQPDAGEDKLLLAADWREETCDEQEGCT